MAGVWFVRETGCGRDYYLCVDPSSHPPSRSLRRAPTTGDVVSRPPSRQVHDEPDLGPSPDDLRRFSGVTRTCSHCGQETFDDALQCHQCGHAFGDGTPPSQPVSKVIIVIALIIIFAGVGVIFRLF